MILLKRNKSITAQALKDGALLLHAQMQDDVHLMDVQLVVDQVSGEIRSAFATMGQAPYGDECRRALGVVPGLVGLRIGRGSGREAFRRVAGPRGCTHLAELVVDAMSAYVPALGKAEMERLARKYRKMGLAPVEVERRVMEGIHELGKRLLPDTCVVYRKDEGSGSGGIIGGRNESGTGDRGEVVTGAPEPLDSDFPPPGSTS